MADLQTSLEHQARENWVAIKLLTQKQKDHAAQIAQRYVQRTINTALIQPTTGPVHDEKGTGNRHKPQEQTQLFKSVVSRQTSRDTSVTIPA